MLDNSAFDRVADVLREDDFYRYDHKLIWQRISKLIERGQPADVVTVFESLQTQGKADEVGGLQYLNALAQETPSAANIRRYGEIVRDRAILRKLISTADEIATNALNPEGRETRQLLDEAESRIFQISEDAPAVPQVFRGCKICWARLLSGSTRYTVRPIKAMSQGFPPALPTWIA